MICCGFRRIQTCVSRAGCGFSPFTQLRGDRAGLLQAVDHNKHCVVWCNSSTLQGAAGSARRSNFLQRHLVEHLPKTLMQALTSLVTACTLQVFLKVADVFFNGVENLDKGKSKGKFSGQLYGYGGNQTGVYRWDGGVRCLRLVSCSDVTRLCS